MNAAKHGEFRFEAVEETPLKSSGAITIFYNGSTTLPKAAGSYKVTFDVAAAPPAWKGATGLSAGQLVIAPKPSTTAPEREALYMNSYGEEKSNYIDAELGIRPAMWINVEGDGFTEYQPLKFNKQPNYFTMEDMVTAIARDIIYVDAGDWVYKFGYPARGPDVNKTQTTVGAAGAMPPGYAHYFDVFRMRCWGVLSLDNFDPFAKVTYGQFKEYLMKTMEWNKKYGVEGASPKYANNFTLTKEILAIAEKRAGIKDTRANAKPVKAEIKKLSREIIYWLDAANDANSTRARIMEKPTKTEYKVGEKFDITGLLAVTGIYGKETNVNSKLTYAADSCLSNIKPI